MKSQKSIENILPSHGGVNNISFVEHPLVSNTYLQSVLNFPQILPQISHTRDQKREGIDLNFPADLPKKRKET